MGDDPADVLLRIVSETARLLGGERARLDLLEPLSGSWLWTWPAATPFNDRIVPEELSGADAGGMATGLAGLAIREGRAVVSGDYMGDTRFRHYPEGDQGVTSVGLHSVVAVPVMGEDGLLGVLQAGHRDRDAFGEDAIRLIDALAVAGVDRDHERPAGGPPRVVAGRAGPDGGCRASAAGDRAPHDDDPGPGRAAAGRRGRGGAAARVERGRDRPARSRHRRCQLGLRRRDRRCDSRRMDGTSGRCRRRVPGHPRAAGHRHRRLRARQPVRGRRGERGLPRRGRDPVHRLRAAHRRGDRPGHARRVLGRGGTVRRRRGRAPRCARGPGDDRDPQRGADPRARPVSRGDGAARRDGANPARDRGARHRDPRPGHDPRAHRGRDATRPRLGRRAPDPHVRRPDLPAAGGHRGRHGRGDTRLAAHPGVPHRRRDQRPRREPGPRDLDAQLRHGPPHPPGPGRPRGRRPDGSRRDGGSAAPRSRRRGDRHARDQLSPAGDDLAGPARDAPGAGRPCGDRALELRPARAARGIGGELPRPRPGDAGRDLAQRRRGPVHVHGRGRGAAVRLVRRGARRAGPSGTSSRPSPMRPPRRRGAGWWRRRTRSGGSGSSSCARTAPRSLPRSRPSRASMAGCSGVRRARSATSASASAWSGSCARARSGTAASSSPRRTSSSRWTDEGSTPSTPTGRRRSSAGRRAR